MTIDGSLLLGWLSLDPWMVVFLVVIDGCLLISHL